MLPGMLALLLLFSIVSPLSTATSDGDALLAAAKTWKVTLPTWTGNDPCQNWEGIECDNSRVSALNLSNKGLTGPIPVEIGELASLVSLDLSNSKTSTGPWNYLSGDLSAISSLTKLQILNVSFNVLNEGFPSAVLQLTSLTALRVDNAGLTGPFPTGLSKLSNLQYLYLGNNSMTGELPSEIGSLANLVELSLWNNKFNSLIPTELANLVNLEYLTLHDCSLLGGLPPAFGNLKNMKKLYLYSNSLTGPIPESWKDMKNLQEMRLQSNDLTKSFPSWILSLTSLESVDISYNYLYGSVLNFTGTSPETLNIACNYFSGVPPTNSSTIMLTDSQNCFGTADDEDNKNRCNQYYTCSEFSKKVITEGNCPICPTPQILVNTTSCVCGQDQGNTVKSKSLEIGKIVGSVVGVALFLLLGLFVVHKWRNPKKSAISRFGRKFSFKEPHEYWEVPKGVQRFSLNELAKATSNFDTDHEIGVGGFGKVFYGVLESGKQVAIKRASTSSMQGTTEFRNEVVLLSRLHHRNLVRLEGFCEDDELQILVYEYVPNGNLHTHLFQNDAGHTFDWIRRLDIAVGIAQGLDYLHSFADPPVIHRDVKPSNILLDNNLVAKLADFGISKATLEFETHISTTPAGTAGYIDPQYFLRRHLTTGSDVYGFGVVLLELITGQKAIDHNRLEEHNLVEWVKLKLKIEGFESVIDPRIGGDYHKDICHDVVQLGIDCASFNKDDRPSMKEVVAILDGCLSAVCPRPHDIAYEPHESSHKLKFEEDRISVQSCEAGVGDCTFNSTVAASNSAFRGSTLLPR